MTTKTINGIEYIVYEAGMSFDPEKSYYFENDLDYQGDVKCLHFYAIKNVIVLGNQYVRGNQYVGGNQDVRYIFVYLFCKWTIRIDRDSDLIKIGCYEKTIEEWEIWFSGTEEYSTPRSDRNFKKIENAFNVAKTMRPLLISMNDKPKS